MLFNGPEPEVWTLNGNFKNHIALDYMDSQLIYDSCKESRKFANVTNTLFIKFLKLRS